MLFIMIRHFFVKNFLLNFAQKLRTTWPLTGKSVQLFWGARISGGWKFQLTNHIA
jgi:hypothetical protein